MPTPGATHPAASPPPQPFADAGRVRVPQSVQEFQRPLSAGRRLRQVADGHVSLGQVVQGSLDAAPCRRLALVTAYRSPAANLVAITGLPESDRPIRACVLGGCLSVVLLEGPAEVAGVRELPVDGEFRDAQPTGLRGESAPGLFQPPKADVGGR